MIEDIFAALLYGVLVFLIRQWWAVRPWKDGI